MPLSVHTWVNGEVADQTLLNTIATSLAFLNAEEALWTPLITSTGGVTVAPTYSLNAGRYIRIGRAIFFEGRVTMTNKGTINAGAILIDGLPAPVDVGATGVNGIAIVPWWAALTTSVMWIGGYIQPNTTQIVLTQRITAGTSVGTFVAADLSNTTDLVFGGLYFTAAA